MRYFVISDNTDTQVGLRLAGVEGVLARTREEGLAAIDEALAEQCADKLAPLKMDGHTPLVVEIPDRYGSRKKDSITRYIREAIGVKV